MGAGHKQLVLRPTTVVFEPDCLQNTALYGVQRRLHTTPISDLYLLQDPRRAMFCHPLRQESSIHLEKDFRHNTASR